MTLVYSTSNADGPGLHVFLVGVGEYPGTAANANAPENWRSATELCRWILNKSNIATWPIPLASLEMLLSGAGEHSEWREVDRCTVSNFREAAYSWLTRASSNRDNMTLFYCAGHSVLSNSEEIILLLDGFRFDSRSPGEHAVSLTDLFRAMAPSVDRPNMARRQLYFYDVGAADHASSFDYLILPTPVLAIRRHLGIPDDRIAPIFSAAVPGANAFSRAGGSSLFTEAILEALDGGAAEPTGGYRNGEATWAITITSLGRFLESFKGRHKSFPIALHFGLTGYVRDFVILYLDKPPPSKSLTFNREPANSGTPTLHALIIGVSSYPYLATAGAKHETFDLEETASPARTAAAIGQWLLENADNLAVPLGSIRLLLSPSEREVQAEPGIEFVGERATRNNVLAAAAKWRSDALTNASNATFFYFAGHGVQFDLQSLVMLLEDFGDAVGGLLYNAIDEATLIGGMAPSRSKRNIGRTQFYFFDCCRVRPTAANRYSALNSTPVFTVELGIEDDRECPVFFASGSGAKAYGMPGHKSFFGTAFLEGWKEAFVDMPAGRRAVTTSSLSRAIDRRLETISSATLKNRDLRQKHRLSGQHNDPVLLWEPDTEGSGARRD